MTKKLIKQLNEINDQQNGQINILFDWECPPRFIDYKNKREFVNFDVDLNKIFAQRKIDNFTEIPRTIINKKTDLEVLRLIKDNRIKFQYYKFIADTNLELVQTKNKTQAKQKFYEFKKVLEQKTLKYPVKISFWLFSDFLKTKKLFKKYKEIYKVWVDKIENETRYQKIWQKQIEKTKNHMGLKDSLKIKEIAKRTIASYAAEGAIFEILETKNENYIWLNSAETDQQSINTTNLARKEKMIIIFPKN
ncbi:MAG: hypothetical protein WCP93_02020 [Candidatus Berkelbacteria bacterium]